MLIRQETPKDYDEIYSLVKKAFETAEHSDGTEQDLVVALRASENFVPELALVAQVDDKIVGHILFSKAKVSSDTVLVLAPLAVLPTAQKKGIGTALIKKAHDIATKLGYSYSLVLGSEKYYPRLGYIPAKKFGVIAPDGIEPCNFMAIKLQNEAKDINGSVTYAKEFGI